MAVRLREIVSTAGDSPNPESGLVHCNTYPAHLMEKHYESQKESQLDHLHVLQIHHPKYKLSQDLPN